MYIKSCQCDEKLSRLLVKGKEYIIVILTEPSALIACVMHLGWWQHNYLSFFVYYIGCQEATATYCSSCWKHCKKISNYFSCCYWKTFHKYEPPFGDVDQREMAVGAGQPVLHDRPGHPTGKHPRGLHQAQSHPDLGVFDILKYLHFLKYR